jgi:hypothetical protein
VRGRAKFNKVQDCVNFWVLDTQHLGNFGHTYRSVTWVVSTSMGEGWVACKRDKFFSRLVKPRFLTPAFTTVSTTSCSLYVVHTCCRLKHTNTMWVKKWVTDCAECNKTHWYRAALLQTHAARDIARQNKELHSMYLGIWLFPQGHLWVHII